MATVAVPASLGRSALERTIRGLLLLTVFLLPFSIVLIVSHSHELVAGRLNQFAVPVLYPQEGLMLLAGLLWLLRRGRPTGLRPYGPLLVVLAIAALSALWAPDPILAAVTASHLAVAFVWLYVLAAELRDAAFAQTLAWTFTASVALQAFWGVGQFLLGHDLGIYRLGESSLSVTQPNVAKVWGAQPHLRAYGSLPHPNVTAAYLVAAIFWAGTVIFWPFRRQPRLRQAALAALLILLGSCLLMTFSRVALVMTALNGSLVILFCYRHWRRLPIAAAIAAGAVVIVAALLSPLLAARTTVESSRETGVTNRLAGYHVAADLIASQPVGVGAGNFVLAAADRQSLPAYQYQPAHNVPLLIGAELGGAAMLLVLWFIIRLGWLFHFMRERDRRANTANFALFALAGVFVMMGLTDHFFWSLPQGLWLISLITAAVISRIPAARFMPRWRKVW